MLMDSNLGPHNTMKTCLLRVVTKLDRNFSASRARFTLIDGYTWEVIYANRNASVTDLLTIYLLCTLIKFVLTILSIYDNYSFYAHFE